MMKVVYDSLTGMGKRFADKIGCETIDILDFDDHVDEDGPFILITRSFNFGEVPLEVEDVMEEHSDKFIGVIATGNKNWGDNFGAAGDKVSKEYGIPLIHKYEGSGFPSDVVIVKEWINNYKNKQEEV